MGVDLTLLPLRLHDYWLAHDILELARDRDFWPAFEELPQHPIPKPLSCYLSSTAGGKTCYGEVEENPYGYRLTYTTVADLMTLKDHEGVQGHWKNRAVWAYLAQMPTDWPVCLYWS